MDYVTRQFIQLTKKLRAELRKSLSDLRNALQEQTEAIREANQTANAKQGVPPEVITHVHLPESIEVHKRTSDASDDKKYRRRTLFVSSITFAVLLGYTVTVFYQLREMINATGVAQAAVNEARHNRLQAEKVFNATIEQFHLDQRAWVGLADIKMKFDEGSYPEISFTFVDSGKTPAREVTTQVYWKASGTMAPDCKGTDWRPFHAPSIPPQGKYILHNPIDNPWYTEDLSQNQYWTQFEGASFVCVFGEISYADIFSEARHTTKFCVYAYPGSPDKFTYCPKSNGMD